MAIAIRAGYHPESIIEVPVCDKCGCVIDLTQEDAEGYMLCAECAEIGCEVCGAAIPWSQILDGPQACAGCAQEEASL